MAEKMRALWRGKINETKTETGSEFQPEEFLEGVPARSLTDEEYRALPEDVRKNVDLSPLYEVRSASDIKSAEKDT